MSDTPISADIAERQAGYVPPTAEQSRTMAALRRDVQMLYNYWMEDPQFKTWQPYPQFVYKMAEYHATYGADPHPAKIAEWGKTMQIPPNVFRSGGGGGGSGMDRANTIRSFETAILNRSQALGLSLDPETISYVARVAEAQNYSSEQLMNVIVGLADFKKIEAGELTASIDEMRSLASSYLITASDATLQDYAKKLATGAATREGIDSYFKAQAKAMNPWLAEYIDAGVAPEELLRPARDMIARSLGISATEVDFTDDRFIRMATIDDEKTGTRLANSRELVKNIRSDEAWANTTEARTAATGLASVISRIFGRSVY